MRLKRLLASMVVALVLLPGCSTVYVDRAQQAADAGKAYAEAMRKVNETAVDRTISFTGTILAKHGARTEPILLKTTKEVREIAVIAAEYDNYLSALGSYFKHLEALAKGDQSKETADAVGGLAESLKKEPLNIKISDDKKKTLSGLAGFVAKEIHSNAVEKALRRDADVVAQAIAIADEGLAMHQSWITQNEKNLRDRAWIDKVRRPFLEPVALGDTWITEWSAQVRPAPLATVLAEARKASKAMHEAWMGALRGSYSLEEVAATLARVKAGLDALNAVKEVK